MPSIGRFVGFPYFLVYISALKYLTWFRIFSERIPYRSFAGEDGTVVIARRRRGRIAARPPHQGGS